MILMTTGHFDEVYHSLKNYSHGRNFTVFRKRDIDPNFYYQHNRRIMPIILLADLGYVFDDFLDTMKYYNEKYNITRKSTMSICNCSSNITLGLFH